MSASLVCSKVLISGLFYLLKNVVTIIYLEKKKKKQVPLDFVGRPRRYQYGVQ